MLTEPVRIADQLLRALEGDAWHGPNLHDVLSDLTAAQAEAHPIAGAHSIWELTLHLTSWAALARERLAARRQIEMNDARNFPSPRGSWPEARAALFIETRALAAEIAALPESELGSGFLYVLLHGVVQHHLYHAGQIALLRKLL